jgi:hypothetical protein
MQVTCLGGPCHELVLDLPPDQDVFRPSAGFRPRYVKLHETPDKSAAWFVLSDLTQLECVQLVLDHMGKQAPHGQEPIPAAAIEMADMASAPAGPAIQAEGLRPSP